jgi:glycosyltransferase involved in cell wall biosynthesis
MNVLIVSTSDISGGAARAAYRLHRALLSQNVDSQMLVQSKSSDDFTVLGAASKVDKMINKLRPSLDSISVRFYKNRTKTLFSPSRLRFSSIVEKINRIKPDIVHLHWICGGMLSVEDIAKINAPIVWNLHDMWAFTGGCHYDEHCEGYKDSCGSCKVLKSNKTRDLSNKVHNRKFKSYSKIKNLTVVGSSQWITQCARDSSLFKARDIVTFPNCLNTELFKPIDKNIARDMFQIPKDKKVILFGAMNSLGDPRKGAKELFEAINLLEVENTVFVIAGSSRVEQSLNLKYPVYFISPLQDEVSLPLMYNVADVIIVPSLQENLANSIVESLSCGVPVVAFDIGGNGDMIEHKKNGYLSKIKNAKDMAHGIEWVLTNKKYDQLALSARDKVLNTFDGGLVSMQYIELYRSILDK